MQPFARIPSHPSLFKRLPASPIRASNESYGVTLIKGNSGTLKFPDPQIRQPYLQSDIDFRTVGLKNLGRVGPLSCPENDRFRHNPGSPSNGLVANGINRSGTCFIYREHRHSYRYSRNTKPLRWRVSVSSLSQPLEYVIFRFWKYPRYG
jgi:hypothetical protein